MSADIGGAFGKAFRFAFSWKRMFPFFLINVIIIGAVFLMIDSVIAIMPGIAAGSFSGLGGFASLGKFLSVAAVLLVTIVVMILIQLFFEGVIVDNASSKKEKSISASMSFVKQRYLSLLGATIISGIVGILVGFIPLIGIILSIIVTWIFFFISQFVVISKKPVVDSLRDSYRLFMNNKLDVIIFWLLMVIITFLLFLLALVPVLIAAMPLIVGGIGALMSGQGISQLLPLVKANMPVIFAGSVVTAIILSYISVFTTSARTFLFMQMKKK